MRDAKPDRVEVVGGANPGVSSAQSATTSRPLPTTITILRQYWEPAEPTTTVTAVKAAVDLIDVAVAAARTELDRLETGERGAVARLVEDAIESGDIDDQAAELGRDSQVPAARHHLGLLEQAASTARSRLNGAMLSDPVYVAWQADIRRLEDEWQRADSDADDRTAALLAFIERCR